tara:strand:- start:47 stop:1525 length:1479 start_codon:yes stop_codon:yes gene_type:complete
MSYKLSKRWVLNEFLLSMAAFSKFEYPYMTLQLYNTLTRKKELFVPINNEHIRMYVCGPTVYDDIHIGNARPLVIFDVLFRLLKNTNRESDITYVRNITDVDDKIIQRAEENNESISDLTNRNILRFQEAALELCCLKPTIEPRATDHISQMINLIKVLIEKGHAYVTDDGEVLFSVLSMPNYGRLSGRNRDEMILGARIEVSSNKRDPADFILWKPSTPNQPGWDSVWGRGRPGWHVECSAMSEEYLGPNFDIHGGGVDLVFPHHENEIAQSECFHPNIPFVKTWIHNGYVMSEGEKMSKSLGNFYTVSDLLKEFPGEALRLALLATHYRQPLDFSKDGTKEAISRLDKYYLALKVLEDDLDQKELISSNIADDFGSSLLDDLNTPAALTVLDKQSSAIINDSSRDNRAQLGQAFIQNANLLGLLCNGSAYWHKRDTTEAEQTNIDQMIKKRMIAREQRDFAEADRIRDELLLRKIILEDGPDGTIWRRGS